MLMCPNGKCVCAVLSEDSNFCKAAESDVTVCPNGNRVLFHLIVIFVRQLKVMLLCVPTVIVCAVSSNSYFL